MNTLCFATNMTSAEVAAWVQAVGSILAILGAAGIAVWQARAQHRSALALARAQRIETVKSLSKLTGSAARAMAHVTGQLNTREAVHAVAEGEARCDIAEFARIDNALAGIPLYALPHQVVSLTMALGSTVRQFKEKVEMALRVHRQMDAAAFADLFRVLGEMNASLELTRRDIEAEADKLHGAG